MRELQMSEMEQAWKVELDWSSSLVGVHKWIPRLLIVIAF